MRSPNRRLQWQRLRKPMRKLDSLTTIATMKNTNLKKKLKSPSINLKWKAQRFNKIWTRPKRLLRRLKRKRRQLIKERRKKKWSQVEERKGICSVIMQVTMSIYRKLNQTQLQLSKANRNQWLQLLRKRMKQAVSPIFLTTMMRKNMRRRKLKRSLQWRNLYMTMMMTKNTCPNNRLTTSSKMPLPSRTMVKTITFLQLRIPHQNTNAINFLMPIMRIVMNMFPPKKLRSHKWQKLQLNKLNPLWKSQKKRNQNINLEKTKEICLMTQMTTTISLRKRRKSTSQHQLQLLKKTRSPTSKLMKSQTKQAPPAMTKSIIPIMIMFLTKNFLPSNRSSLTELPPSSLAPTQKSYWNKK